MDNSGKDVKRSRMWLNSFKPFMSRMKRPCSSTAPASVPVAFYTTYIFIYIYITIYIYLLHQTAFEKRREIIIIIIIIINVFYRNDFTFTSTFHIYYRHYKKYIDIYLYSRNCFFHRINSVPKSFSTVLFY